MSDQLLSLWDRAISASRDRQWIKGRLGFLSEDGLSVKMQVDSRPDYVYVRLGANGNRGIDLALRHPNIPLRPGLAVKMIRENGILIIKEIDYFLMENDPNAPPTESGVPFHLHSFTDLSDTPDSYTGQAGRTVRVQDDELGLEFADKNPVRDLLTNGLEETPELIFAGGDVIWVEEI